MLSKPASNAERKQKITMFFKRADPASVPSVPSVPPHAPSNVTPAPPPPPPPQKTIEKKKERKKRVTFTDDQKIVPRPGNVNEIIQGFQHIEGTRYKNTNGMRSLARLNENVIHKYDVIDGRIFPALDSKTIPPQHEREVGQIYLNPKIMSAVKATSLGKNGCWVMDRLCQLCPYMKRSGLSQANFPHFIGGPVTICGDCNKEAGFNTRNQNRLCTKCVSSKLGNPKFANYSLTPGGKGKSLCMEHSKEEGSYAPQSKKKCPQCDKESQVCVDHTPIENLSVYICRCCFQTVVNSKLYSQGERFCSSCRQADPTKQIKLRIEKVVGPLITKYISEKASGVELIMKDDVLLGSGVNSKSCDGIALKKRRPDLAFRSGNVFVFVEVDEHCHSAYSCARVDAEWIVDVSAYIEKDLAFKNCSTPISILFIRFNPDKYDSEVDIFDRCKAVAERAVRFFNYYAENYDAVFNNPFLSKEDFDFHNKKIVDFFYYREIYEKRIQAHASFFTEEERIGKFEVQTIFPPMPMS